MSRSTGPLLIGHKDDEDVSSEFRLYYTKQCNFFPTFLLINNKSIHPSNKYKSISASEKNAEQFPVRNNASNTTQLSCTTKMLMRENYHGEMSLFYNWYPEELSLGSKFEVNSTISIPHINKTTVTAPLMDSGVITGINSFFAYIKRGGST